jgi:hypothetical protein
MASGTRSEVRKRKSALDVPVLYYAVNRKKAKSVAFADHTDEGQILLLLEEGSRTLEELRDELQASLDWMEGKAGKDGVGHPHAMEEGYNQHKYLKENLGTILEKLCKSKILVCSDTRKSKPWVHPLDIGIALNAAQPGQLVEMLM